MSKSLTINCDGACSGNPGPAAFGCIIQQNGEIIGKVSGYLGEATNNIAEYYGVIYSLQEALIRGAKEVTVITDSELIYKQINGMYKIKNENMKVLFDQVKHLSQGFEHVEVKHVKREKNKEADKLASSLLKEKQAEMVASLF